MIRFRLLGTLVVGAALAGAVFAAPLAEGDVTVNLRSTPATAFKSAVHIARDASGAERVEVSITNASGADAAIEEWTIQLPWQRLAEGHDLLSTGGWDMGRSEARVWTPRQAEKIETGSYLLARKASGYSFAGFTTWRRFNAKLRFTGGGIVVTGQGEGRRVHAGETLPLERIWLTSGADWPDILFAYADEIARENRIRLNVPKPYIGWATWDYYGRNWTAEQVMGNTKALLEIYPKADFVQIDGGWWPERGDYTQVRANLQPDGMKRLAQFIRGKNLIAGIHLDGMRGDMKAQVAREHPEYFLRDAEGGLLVSRTLNVGEHLDYTYFDYSSPGARDYIKRVMTTIRRDWGYDYFKVDFLRFGLNEFIQPVVPEGAKIVPHDSALTSVERFHLGMAAMREGMGADAYFLGCSAVFGPTFGHVDGLRTGADINPQFRQFKRCAVDNSGNFYLHGRVVYNDADYHVVRAKEDQDETRVKAANKDGKDMTLDEAWMWTHYVALCGGPRLNSDDLMILREERRALFRFAAEFPTAECFVPLDFWSHARTDEDVSSVILTKAKGDTYLGTFNWTDADRQVAVGGFTPEEIATLAAVGGHAPVRKADGRLTVTLPAHQSAIFKLAHGNFERLRHVLTVE